VIDPAKNTIQEISSIALSRGVTETAEIDPNKDVVLKSWVRLKCRYGCNMYNTSWVCPPHNLTLEQALDFFQDYRAGLLFKFTALASHANQMDYVKYKNWTKVLIAGLERKCVQRKFNRAFALHSGPCTLCWNVRPNGLISYRDCTLFNKKTEPDESVMSEDSVSRKEATESSREENVGLRWRRSLRFCRFPNIARPAMEALCIDVFQTVRNCGWDSFVLTSRHQIPTYYSMLLLD
jgi:predicted metal-binding protein